MISQREIEHLSEKLNLSKSTIDKDWVLGHFLDAIYSISELKKVLIFKGGTCLKKCYLPDYRFSEDLDFTVTDKDFVFTDKMLDKVIKLVHKRTGIACHVVSLTDLIFKNQKTGYETIVKYWGADHPKNQIPPSPDRWQTSIKIEIILYELMLFPAVRKKLFHTYSDKLSSNAQKIACYSIEEILTEKIRALIQRKYTAPRDYYDIWYLSRNYDNLDSKKIVSTFYKKMKYKNIEFTGVDQLINSDSERILEKNWKNSLGHQIPEGKLPDCKIVISEVKKYFKILFTK